MNAEHLQDLAVAVLNVSLMYSVGLELQWRSIRAATRRGMLLGGLTVHNFAIIPAVTWAVAWALGVPAPVMAGLMLAAVAPGGGTGTLLTRLSRGDLALSVVGLGVLTAGAVGLTPLLSAAVVPVGDGASMPLDQVMSTLVWFQLAPLCAGIGLQWASPRVAGWANRVARPLSNGVFVLLVVGLLFTRGALVFDVGWSALATMVVSVSIALGLPALWRLEPAERSAMMLTSGVRNLSLSLLLATQFLGDLATLSVLVYGLVMYLLAIPLALYLRPALVGP